MNYYKINFKLYKNLKYNDFDFFKIKIFIKNLYIKLDFEILRYLFMIKIFNKEFR